MRYWASLDLRKVGLTPRDRYDKPNAEFILQMKKRQGYMPVPRADAVLPDDYFSRTGYRAYREVSITPRDAKYLDKFVTLAGAKGIKIVFMGLVLPTELYDILRKNGFNGRYDAFVEELKRRYPKDVATGYRAGDLRGAVSVSIPLAAH